MNNDALEFILIKIALLYTKNMSKLDDSLNAILELFSNNNNFDLLKINLYPFLITVRNGHKEHLLDFFGKFEYTEYGMYNGQFLAFLLNKESTNLEFTFQRKKLNIKLKHNSVFQNYDYLNAEMLLNEIINNNNVYNDTQIVNKINKSIDSICRQFPEFITCDIEELTFLNRYSPTYRELDVEMRKISVNDSEKISKLLETFNEDIKYEYSSLQDIEY